MPVQAGPETVEDGAVSSTIRWSHDALGLAWVVVAGLAVLVPALVHGVYLGSFDILANHGVTSQAGVTVHNTDLGDQVSEFIPWLSLSWQQVHAGHLPLWNPYSGLGAPLAFNFQSAPLGLPALVSYLFPLRLAFTVSVITTAVVAGTGGYVCGRVLRMGVIASALVGTVFELSGPMIGWIGSPLAASISWIGWLVALTVLMVRHRGQVWHLLLAGVVTALAILGGSPETVVLMFIAVLIFAVVSLLFAAVGTRHYGDVGRSGAAMVVGWVLGALLAAPVLLPGLQLARGSIRAQSSFNYALPLHDLAYFVTGSFDGLPLSGARSFGTLPTIETLSFVGSTTVVLAVVAIVHRWRRVEVVAPLITLVVCLALVFVPAVVDVARGAPLIGTVLWQRALFPAALSLAILAGSGVDCLVRRRSPASASRTLLAASVALSVLLGTLTLWGRSALDPSDAAARLHGLEWALVGSLASAAIGAVLIVLDRSTSAGGAPSRRSGCGMALLAVETLLLLVAGAPWISSSATGPPVTAASVRLQRTVGAQTVGFGSGACLVGYPDIGYLPNSNLLYDVHQLDVYDATTPASLFSAWKASTGSSAGVPLLYEFCPRIATSAEARLYGVSWVLVGPNVPGPTGSVLAGAFGNERLYRVPGAATATLVALSSDGAVPPNTEQGTPEAVSHPDPASWRVVTRSGRPADLRLRLLDVAGWHATVDGRPVSVRSFAGTMVAVKVPAGAHTVELEYWPAALTAGTVLALGAAGLMLGLVLLTWLRRRRAGDRDKFHPQSCRSAT